MWSSSQGLLGLTYQDASSELVEARYRRRVATGTGVEALTPLEALL